MEVLLNLAMGVGLSAACGFRIFVPLLVMSAAAKTGNLALSSQFQWIGTDAALITFAAATVIEIAAYYVPWVDNLLDTIATPLAVVAGVLATAAVMTDIHPYFRWILAAIAGGGVAGAVQGVSVLSRGASSAGTGGIANPVLATFEWGSAGATAILSIFVPLLTLVALAIVLTWIISKIRRRRADDPPAAPSEA